MNQCKCLLISLGLFFIVNILSAQKLPPVDFDFGTVQFGENLSDKESLNDVLELDLSRNSFYFWVQFDQLLDLESKKALSQLDVHVQEYVSSQCYLMKIPRDVSLSQMRTMGARSIMPMMQAAKLDGRVVDEMVPEHARLANGLIQLHLIAMPGVEVSEKKTLLKKMGGEKFRTTEHNEHIFLSVNRSSALEIAELSWVRYLEVIPRPGEPESVEGMTMQRANLLNNSLTGGHRFDGSGVKILVRDDGDVGPHIDFQGRLWNDPGNQSQGTHGDGVAGVFAAAGNLDPTVIAGGSGADIFALDYEASFLDRTLSLHQDSGVLITNSSYSNGCNAGYTLATIAVDEQMFENPTLMHVFSAGNSNNNECGYGAGDQWGNVTGGHKQGKNVITTANLDREGELAGTSSRGPAHDGRIKPDLAAHGAGQISTNPDNQYRAFGGTSAAAPTVASSMTQLYQAYFELHGAMPQAALIKACAMNSAQDLGNPGPDFKFGWGSMHAERAYEILANDQYFVNSIDNGGSQTIPIDVPAGIGQLRVMLYWSDPPASLNAATALVNDLDLTVDDPSAVTQLPYLLNHAPNAITLDEPATQGADHLNNVEQVAILTPEAGTYTVNIAGTAIADGPQEYFIVYSYISEGVNLTYPIGNEKLVQNVTERIHWDAFGNTDVFILDYSIDGGTTWETIQSNVPAEVRTIDWTPPAVVSGECIVRIHRGAENDQSDETFSIHGVPKIAGFTLSAIDSAIMHWSPVDKADSYTIYRLGEENMEVVGQSPDTFFAVGNLEDLNTYWLSVSANTGTAQGQRALAFNYDHGIYTQCSGCLDYLPLPYLEDFESGVLGYHCNSLQDSFNWTTIEEATPTSNTGPSQASGGYKYAYIESTSNNPFKSANLGGPCLDFTSCTNAYMQFDYHMFGVSIGELSLIVSEDAGETWSSPIWSKRGHQGDQWNREVVDLTEYCGGSFLYQFIGTTGNGFRGDIAIDQIYIDEGVVCHTPGNMTLDSTGQTNALVSWPGSTNGGPYDLELVDQTANMSFTGIPTVVNVSDTTYHFTGLTAINEYDVYLRAQCGADSSTWIGPLSFLPGCADILGNSFENPLEVLAYPYADTNSLDQICSRSFWETDERELVYRLNTGNGDKLHISTCNGASFFDTHVFLLDSTKTIIDDNDDAEEECTDLGFFRVLSTLDVDVIPHTTYYVVVAGFDENDFGPYALHINVPTCDSAQMTTQIDTSIVAGTVFLGNTIFNDTVVTVVYTDSMTDCDVTTIYDVKIISSAQDISVGNITISPNPFDQFITIESPIKLESIQILNAQGMEIKRINYINEVNSIVPMHDFPTGIYFIIMETERGLYSAKMMKS